MTVVKPRMSENSTDISRRLPPSSASSGMRDQLLIDILRDVSAEEPLDYTLLGPLDEITVGRPRKERQGHRRERLGDVQPEAALEGGERVPGQTGHGAQRAQGRSDERQQRRHQANDRRRRNH